MAGLVNGICVTATAIFTNDFVFSCFSYGRQTHKETSRVKQARKAGTPIDSRDKLLLKFEMIFLCLFCFATYIQFL